MEGGKIPTYQLRTENTSASPSLSMADSEFSSFSRIYPNQKASQMATQHNFLQSAFNPTDEDACAIDDTSEDEDEEPQFLDFRKRHVARFQPQHQVVGAIKQGLLRLGEPAYGVQKQSKANQAPMLAKPRSVKWGKGENESQEVYNPTDVMMSFLMAHAARAATYPGRASWKRMSSSGALNSWDFETGDYLMKSSRECGWCLW
jgi:hypothetical protein